MMPRAVHGEEEDAVESQMTSITQHIIQHHCSAIFTRLKVRYNSQIRHA